MAKGSMFYSIMFSVNRIMEYVYTVYICTNFESFLSLIVLRMVAALWS